MPSLQPSADYTDRDLASLRTRFQALIKSVFTNWTDFQTSNFGNILVDLYAWSADIQGYYLDANAAEAFITTATQRRSLLKLAALVGYTPKGAGAASTVETFTATGLTADCDIPAGTVVSTLSGTNPIEFQTLSPIVLTVAAPSATVTVENSTAEAESFASTGQPDQTITLGNKPYLDKSLSITTTQGTFTEVASFVNSGPSDLVFVVKVDDNDQATVYFGDGVVAGIIPTGTMSAVYKTGGGAIGNAAAGSIQQIAAPLLDVHGALCSVVCTNAAAATGGTDREGAEAIRENAPASLTKRAVSVSRQDFEGHAKEIPGVARALYITSNEDSDVPENGGYLYLISPGASGPDAPNPITKDAVRRQFQSDETPPWPMMATQMLAVWEPPFWDIDVVARIYLKKAVWPSTVKAAILAGFANFFALTTADGSENTSVAFAFCARQQSMATTPKAILAASDIENIIRDAAGVREVGPNPTDLTIGAQRMVYDQTSGTYLGSVTNPYSMITTATLVVAPARADLVLDAIDPAGGPPASAAFPRLRSVTLLDGDHGDAVL